VSTAIAAHLVAYGTKGAEVDDIKSVVGKGIEGTTNGVRIRAGNSRWLQTESDPQVAAFLAQGYTVFCVVIGTQLSAVFGLEDSLRPEAAATVAALQKRGVSVSIVSGDDDSAVRDYMVALAAAAADNKKKPVVTLFCGDGANDAIALVQATIGVHINATSDVAQSAADAVLLRPSLAGVLLLMDLSGAAVRRIAFNFAWSFTYNLFAILLAAGAFVKAHIPSEYAGLGELVSVLPVILIALQLRWVKFRY
jgi:Cu2+-exporting ATPase